ncbi:6-hydroxymethylpterin diphosphokinase MptE-like protein [Marinomonas fungiae]|uniref:DUF115 domain-containing protein n=1 Tax=Marinomonas fungiae TaxID=1137284 RepID=A0A0K6III6_9GAMM|nr:6-hydroxymethylpterin diphosphokinase MptE-like protein [Marinomonas fungiae]CUB02891.1 Protein of unknown function DUF115 [Marinomonas fungiae]
MNNNISQLTLSDEIEQQKLEKNLAETVKLTKQKNIQAFHLYAPYLLEFLEINGDDTLSIFCTSKGKANIVDYSTGQCWYGDDPEVQIKEALHKEISQISKLSLTAGGDNSLPPIHYVEGTPFISPESLVSTQGVKADVKNSKIPLWIQFGLGVGSVLKEVSNLVEIDNWLVYEPSIEVFKASVDAFDWASWLEGRVKNDQQVYLQIGNNASTIVEDIEFIKSETDLSEAYLYRHYHHPEMDSLYQYLTSALFSWQDLLGDQVTLMPFTDFCDEVLPIRPKVELMESESSKLYWSEAKHRYLYNIKIFQQYYPDIASIFLDFTPEKWHLVLSESGQWNLLHLERGAFFYGEESKAEALSDLKRFEKNPLKDDPMLNVNGGKLAYYQHYSKSAIIKDLFKESSFDIGGFSSEINGLIFFGLGLGFQLGELLEDKMINNLFVYEPNFDYFYASLYVLDWAFILEKMDRQKGRLHLNLGDDGSHAAQDIPRIFNTVGNYNVVSTYIYPLYHHSKIQQSVYELKQELECVVSLGEYFEHVRYGVSHMNSVFASGNSHLVHHVEMPNKDLLDLPVFIVGNGPSIDNSYTYIKENRKKVILISCGTALRALYNYGIKPDFHAEVEQNRSNYHWVSNAADKEFLKDISLLSVHGVHPDTASLFKKTVLIFKSGEAAVRVYSTIVERLRDYPELEYSYPTVSNLVISMMCFLGMKEIYLFGVDLGYKDLEYHHSKKSDYYKRNDESEPDLDKASSLGYNYAQMNGVMTVPGNFEKNVFTKREFKMSAQIIERVLEVYKETSCFNCSDGAKINGSIPLLVEDIELRESKYLPSDFQEALIEELCLSTDEVVRLSRDFNSGLDLDVLKGDVERFLKWIRDINPKNEKEMEKVLTDQRDFFYESVTGNSSVFFYLFWGSMNYYSALILKLAYTEKDSGYEERLSKAWSYWVEHVEEVFYDYYNNPDALDQTGVENKNFN